MLATVDDLPLAPGFAGGIAAFVGGFALFVAAIALSGSPDFSTPIRTLKQLGSLFFNAQNVPLDRHREIAIGTETVVQEASVNIIQQAPQTSLPPIVYYVIPVVAIAIVAGWLALTYLDSSRPLETAAAVVAGTTLGYLLSALVGSFLVAQRTSQGAAFETLRPAIAWTFAYGIAYPLAITVIVVAVVVGWRRFTRTTAEA